MKIVMGFVLAILGVTGLATFCGTIMLRNALLGLIDLGISSLAITILMPKWAKWMVSVEKK